MKRLCSCFLSVVVLLSIVSVSGSALTQSKFDQPLCEAIDTAEDNDLISVWIWFSDIDQNEFDQRVAEKTGMTKDEVQCKKKESNLNRADLLEIMDALQNPNLTDDEREILLERRDSYFRQLDDENRAFKEWYNPYLNIRNSIMKEMYFENNSCMLQILKIPDNDVLFIDTTAPTAIVKTDKNTILSFENEAKVTAVYLFQDQEVYEPITVSKSLKDKLSDYLSELTSGYDSTVNNYEELYVHEDEAGEMDWVLIYAQGGVIEPWIACCIVNHRVIIGDTFELFRCGMGIYDAKKDTFFDLTSMQDYSAYDGLAEAIDAYGKGKLIGDVDSDNEITILDATKIQRVFADLDEFPESDDIGDYSNTGNDANPPCYYSDFDRDGARTILDATAIQRHLAGLS